MAGYAFARLRFRGRDLVFAIVIAALMVPPIFTLLPNFVLVKDLGLLNTMAGMVAPTLLMTPFAVFFLRQFFLVTARATSRRRPSSTATGRGASSGASRCR